MGTILTEFRERILPVHFGKPEYLTLGGGDTLCLELDTLETFINSNI
jgi:hypothetical protein